MGGHKAGVSKRMNKFGDVRVVVGENSTLEIKISKNIGEGRK